MLINIVIVIMSILEGLCGILLVAIILLQKSKGQGAAAGLAFGAGMGESLFGAQATNILQKITVVLTTIFLVNTTLLAFIGGRRHHGGRSVTDSLPSAPPIEATSPQPGMPAGAPAAPTEMPPPVSSPVKAPSAAAEPMRMNAPVSAPAAPAAQAPSARGTDAGRKPAQP